MSISNATDHTRDDLRRADTNAATHTIAIAGLAALIGQIGKDLPRDVLLAVSASALPAAATLLCALAVMRPRRAGGTGMPGSWLHAARSPSWRTLLDDYEQAPPVEIDARQLWLLARITENKYCWVKRSTTMLATTVAFLVAAFLYAAVRALATIIF